MSATKKEYNEYSPNHRPSPLMLLNFLKKSAKVY
jgi:hypothetical protein